MKKIEKRSSILESVGTAFVLTMTVANECVRREQQDKLEKILKENFSTLSRKDIEEVLDRMNKK